MRRFCESWTFRWRCCRRSDVQQRGLRHGSTSGGVRGSHCRASPETSRRRCLARPALTRAMAKNTYGTGCFLLMNTGPSTCVHSKNGLLTTIAAGLDGKITLCAGGQRICRRGGDPVAAGRAAAYSTRRRTRNISLTRWTDNGGVYIVPAFTGLGAPYWDMYARGAIVGLTRGTNREHIIRAALGIHRLSDHAMCWTPWSADTGVELQELRVDGGASATATF